MRDFIESFKKLIRFVVTIFASREFAFIYCLVGTASQVTHTYFLTEAISSFSGNFRMFQAVLISFFISSSLLYFVAIADNSDTKESRRTHLAINIFMIIEILINLYYYTRHLIIDSETLQIFDFVFAAIISGLLPITIKLYANTIRAKEWIDELAVPVPDKEEDGIDLHEKISNLIDNRFLELDIPEVDTSNFVTKEYIENKFKEDLDTEVANIFDKNQKLFLTQFENKCKVFMKKELDNNLTKIAPEIKSFDK